MTPTSPSSDAPPTATDPAGVVRRFLEALEALDVDAALELLADDVTYHNRGLPPARGKAVTAKQLRLLGRYATGFEARNHHVAAEGGVVLTERTDVIVVGRWRCEFWVCGTFEVRDGRIVLWRDHFDYVTLTFAALKGLVRAALAGRNR